jgi:hypothetical protein
MRLGLSARISDRVAPTAEVAGALKYQPTAKWRQDFEAYLSGVPPYYLPLLRNGVWHCWCATFESRRG